MTRSNGFTRFSHDLLNGIIESELTTRQIKIILLLQRLISGCHREWAMLRQCDFQSCNIKPSHIEEVKNILLNKKAILQNGSKQEYKINEDYFIKDHENPTRLVELVGKHLRRKSSQKGNSTIPNSGISDIPKREVDTSQDGNTASHDLALMKDKYIHNIKDTDKDISIGVEDRTYEEIIEDPQTKIESDAVELHNMLEPDNVPSLAYYLKILHRISVNKLFPIACEIKDDPSVQKKNMGKLFVFKTFPIYQSSLSH